MYHFIYFFLFFFFIFHLKFIYPFSNYLYELWISGGKEKKEAWRGEKVYWFGLIKFSDGREKGRYVRSVECKLKSLSTITANATPAKKKKNSKFHLPPDELIIYFFFYSKTILWIYIYLFFIFFCPFLLQWY